jgi:hypothetical protein
MNRLERRRAAKEAKRESKTSRSRSGRVAADDGEIHATTVNEDVVGDASSSDADDDRATTTTATTTATRGKKKGRRSARERDGANEEVGFWGRISWLHLFFLGMFVLPTAFALLDYFFAFTPPPGQGYGSLTPEARMIREKIKAFYSEYNPEKLRTVDELMIKYKGRERALYNTIKKKYRRSGAKRVDQRFDE